MEIKIPDIEITEKLHESQSKLVFRGIRADNIPVMLKFYKQEGISNEKLYTGNCYFTNRGK
jgi:hypothetical protein